MSKNYITYITKNNETLEDVSNRFYYETSHVDDIFNFKGNDEEYSNKDYILVNYTEKQRKDNNNEANKNIINEGTVLSIPNIPEAKILSFKNNEYNIEDIYITKLDKSYWSIDVQNWWEKRNNILTIDFNKGRETLVKQFHRAYIKIYSRALNKIVNASPYLIDVKTQVGNFGGGFNFNIQPVQGFFKDGEYIIDQTTYYGDQFLSKTTFDVDNLEKVRHNFYFDQILNPQDLVIVKFGEDFKDKESIDLNTDEDFDMIGLIDETNLSINQENETFNVSISVTGRDLSKIFIEDGTHFFAFEYYASVNGDMNEAYKNFMVSANDNNKTEKVFPKRIFGTLSELELTGNRTLEFLINFIINKLKNITLDLSDKNGIFGDKKIEEMGIWKFIDFDIEENVAKRILFSSSLTTMSGSIINFLKQVLQEPFIETLTDTIGNKFRFLIRTPPTQKDTYKNNITIEISAKYLLQDNTKLSDKNVYSWFMLRPTNIFFGDKELSPTFLPATYFEKLAKIYGSRKFDKQHSYVYYNTQNTGEEGLKINARIQSMEDFKFLIESFIMNCFLREGNLVFSNIKGIKRGMNIYIPEFDMLYYVDGYSHDLTLDSQISVVNVSRGMRKRDYDLYYSIIEASINKEQNRFNEVKFNNDVFDKLMKKNNEFN